MKKILLATTALVGFAGVAAADDNQNIKLSGYAEIGVVGGDRFGETQFWNDVNVTITMSRETDSGLSFGVALNLEDLDSKTGAEIDPQTDNDTAVWVSGSFGKVTLGDTDGAFDWALTEAGALTSIADDHTTHVGWSGNGGLDDTYDNQVMRYEYSFGDFAAGFSAELDDTGAADPVLGLGVKWSGDMGGTAVSAGLGYQATSNAAGVDSNVVGVSVTAAFAGGFNATANYWTMDTGAANDTTHTGLSVGYTSGPLAVDLNWGETDNGVTSDDGWGLAANYDLGGGAVAMFGYGSDVSAATAGNQDSWSLGLGLSF